MDSALFEFLIDANPASATALLCAVVFFFYKIFDAHKRYIKKKLEEHSNLMDKHSEDVEHMFSQLKDTSNEITNLIKELKMQIDVMDEKIKKIEEADFGNKIDLMYLKKDIESIRKCVEVHHLSTLSFTPLRIEK